MEKKIIKLTQMIGNLSFETNLILFNFFFYDGRGREIRNDLAPDATRVTRTAVPTFFQKF